MGRKKVNLDFDNCRDFEYDDDCDDDVEKSDNGSRDFISKRRFLCDQQSVTQLKMLGKSSQ